MYSSIDEHTYRNAALFPTIHKTPTEHEISYNARTQIQSQIDILKGVIEKTNNCCTEFRDDIKKKLEHKSIRERDENEIL